MSSIAVRYSIIIPCFNASAFAGRAIESALAQGRDDYEIIVVDDGSEDNTLEILEMYAVRHKERIRCLHQENRGPAAARNAGVKAANGQYIYFLDADDQMTSSALNTFEGALTRYGPGLSYVYAGHYAVRRSGRIKALCPARGLIDNERDFKRFIAGRGVSPTIGAVAVHRECFRRLAFPETLRCNEDVVLFGHLFALYKGAAVADPVVYKYRQAGSLRSDSGAIEDAAEKAPAILFDPSILPPAYLRFRALYTAGRYLEKARIHFKAREFREFRKAFRRAVREHRAALLRPRFWGRYIRSHMLFFTGKP